MEDFIRGLPKAELHMHVEGSLEPEMMIDLARRNAVSIPFESVDEIRAAYRFTDLQSFLDLYYRGASVLVAERDFHDLTRAYLERASADNVRHVEIFFDPQTHTERGVPFETVITGIHRALEEGRRELGVTSKLIMCVLRHLDEQHAMRTLEQALPFRDWIAGIGLDSSELGNPPERFERVFARARDLGWHAVAHAGEEGPPEYVWQALDLLRAERIDHGVRSLADPSLVERLVAERVPLTVCPLSNVRLRVFPTMEQHNLGEMLERGLRVTINSDDPAYFGGYLVDNYVAAQRALALTREQVTRLADNGLRSTFLGEDEVAPLLTELADYVARA